MKTERYELDLLGSNDGVEWKPYVFRHKPGNVGQRPGIVMPHQPRLDWRMWFVTLHPVHMPWFAEFLQALLDNSPSVTALLEHNPFPDKPPGMIRVDLWRYQYASPQVHAETGQWWEREYMGPFPPLPWIQKEMF